MAVNSPYPGAGALVAMFDIGDFPVSVLAYRESPDSPSTYPLNVALTHPGTGLVIYQERDFDANGTDVCLAAFS